MRDRQQVNIGKDQHHTQQQQQKLARKPAWCVCFNFFMSRPVATRPIFQCPHPGVFQCVDRLICVFKKLSRFFRRFQRDIGSVTPCDIILDWTPLLPNGKGQTTDADASEKFVCPNKRNWKPVQKANWGLGRIELPTSCIFWWPSMRVAPCDGRVITRSKHHTPRPKAPRDAGPISPTPAGSN